MNRRKLWAWATATCCLAFAGAAQARDRPATLGKPQPATLGKPIPGEGFVARGVAPNPGYPRYIPRDYTAPNPPTYATNGPAPALETPLPGGFAADSADPMTGPAPGTPAIMPSGPMAMPAGPGTSTPFLDGTATPSASFPVADNQRPGFWVVPEFINWQSKGVGIPALVTTAPLGSAGTLDSADTTILYGHENVVQNWRSGLRVRAGMPLGDSGSSIEAAFLFLGRTTDTFSAASNGNPGLFRPFRDASTGLENSQLIAFIANGTVLTGGVSVVSTSDLIGGELTYRSSLASVGLGNKFDFLVGYRYLFLRDTLGIRADLTAGPAAPLPVGTQIVSFDRFETRNQFHGGTLGFANEWQLGRMTFGLRSTVALGFTNQRIDIDGSTGTSAGVNARGGLLAQTTNIGANTYDRFSVIPEVGSTIGFQLTPRLKVFGGYNFLYWTNVTRAGEQIDRDGVNSTFIPDPTGAALAPAGDRLPNFRRRDTGYWAHGWSVGVEWKW